MARKVTPRANGEQTRAKILLAAEKLFADAGFDGVSMRQVGGAADLPFALVTYHFETKLGLYKAVFKRRADAISSGRVDHLEAIRLGPDRDGNFMAIARALVEPLMLMRDADGGANFIRLMAREVHDPIEGQRGIVAEYFDPVAKVAMNILREAAPQASDKRIAWAYHFATGALAVNYADTGRIERLSNNQCQIAQTEELMEELARFIACGLQGALIVEI